MFNTWCCREAGETGGEREKEIEEGKVPKKKEKELNASSDEEATRRRRTAMPIITPRLVRGRDSDQRSCIDNPRRRVRRSHANTILSN